MKIKLHSPGTPLSHPWTSPLKNLHLVQQSREGHPTGIHRTLQRLDFSLFKRAQCFEITLCQVVEGMQAMRQAGLLCDVTLVAENLEVHFYC